MTQPNFYIVLSDDKGFKIKYNANRVPNIDEYIEVVCEDKLITLVVTEITTKVVSTPADEEMGGTPDTLVYIQSDFFVVKCERL